MIPIAKILFILLVTVIAIAPTMVGEKRKVYTGVACIFDQAIWTALAIVCGRVIGWW